MLDVIIALLPTTIAGVWIYGLRSLAVLAVGIGSAVIAEFIFNLIAKKPCTVGDLSAVVTGLLLALSVHSNMPLWQVAIGAAFAIVIVKGVFGGIGQNFANPAITGRLLMAVSFGEMAKAAFPVADTVSKATPLAVLESNKMMFENGVYFIKNWKGDITGQTDLLSLFLGTRDRKASCRERV
jgi:electron transport complex protein RnfD